MRFCGTVGVLLLAPLVTSFHYAKPVVHRNPLSGVRRLHRPCAASRMRMFNFNLDALTAFGYNAALSVWAEVPSPLRVLMRPRDLLAYLVFRTCYSRALRLGYFVQTLMSRLLRKEIPPPAYLQTVLGFLEPRFAQLSRLTGLIYLVNVCISALTLVDLSIRPGLDRLFTKLAYTAYAGYFLNEVRRFVFPRWFPKLAEDKRRAYIVDRSASVFFWTITTVLLLDLVSTFFNVPLSSSLALGGVGGVAIGLASKDVVSNFVGGLMLLITEPFTPGDFITFLYQGVWMIGKVERVGWYQTRIRNRDTRPVYVPNAFFVNTMVTNMDRITHRKFESEFHIQLDSFAQVEGLLDDIKIALQGFPKLDLLSPFRANLIAVDSDGLKFSVLCYFATKSFDEFLMLQQRVFLEVGRCVEDRGLRWAFPRRTIDVRAREIGSLMVEGMMEESLARQQPGAKRRSIRRIAPVSRTSSVSEEPTDAQASSVNGTVTNSNMGTQNTADGSGTTQDARVAGSGSSPQQKPPAPRNGAEANKTTRGSPGRRVDGDADDDAEVDVHARPVFP